MAFDGLFLRALIEEIKEKALNSKVEKLFLPENDEIVILLHRFGQSLKLLISANANIPRIHFTTIQKENPKAAPMFCMLLRKHLTGAKLINIEQLDFERIAKLTFLCYDELGEQTKKYLIVEIMGRHSNIIFINNDNKIIDSIKRIDLSVSTQRQVLPSLKYELPPAQDKKSILDFSFDNFIEFSKEKKLDKALLNYFYGFSPLISREISYLATKQIDIEVDKLSNEQKEKLKFHLNNIKDKILNNNLTPIMLIETVQNKPFEFSFFEILQYGAKVLTVKCETFSDLLDSFYEKRDKIDRMKQKSADILKVLSNASDRINRKISAQNDDLKNCKAKENFKLFGELINANIYRIDEKSKQVSLENFYNNNELIEIKLDENISLAKNAQKYFKEYRKANKAITLIKEQISKANQELLYLDSVFDGLAKAENEIELNEIRQELKENGYLRVKNQEKTKKKPVVSNFMKFISSDGFTILAGKNNLQNDRLTTKTATKKDIWFHIKNFAGSHTVIITEDKQVTDRTLTESAIIAAYFSRANASSNVAVDYTLIKNVKKPYGGKAGMVIYDNFKTAFVTPDKELVEKLRVL